MKRLFSVVMSIFLLVFITLNLSSASALAQNNSDFLNSEEKPTLESLENHLKTIELLLLSTQGDQPEPEETTEIVETESLQQESGQSGLVSEAVNMGTLNQFKARIDSWSGLPNFSGNEITRLLYNKCRGLQNSVPPSKVWNNIAPTLAVLQRLRTDLGTPINMTSVYRHPDYNTCVDGVANSFHSLRYDNKSMTAIDFYANSGNPRAWTKKLRSYRGQTFTNPATEGTFTFAGGIGTYGTFTHIDTRGYNSDFGPNNF
ncbi:D-Ala-D-Ala carboxypeptidase family metallohydrolase [Coleofasciculus sp. F4-SAH-05]|uniref:D-Ala-D-Ala carboxypeptidase family metallohydrolase n=1 Tax=Coleofasciculus TaxID=669368 RepID=UPI0032F7EA11